MGKFLDTRGEAVLSPYVCDRCKLRGAFSEMVEDEDKQGLWVHKNCSDQLDPWKLPPRESEDITIPHPRRDQEITGVDPGLETNPMQPKVLTDEKGKIITP